MTYNVWIGGSCDYGHKERAGGAAVIIEQHGEDVIAELHTTEFRMMLTLMLKVMDELPEQSDIVFLTNAAYIQNYDKTPTEKSANSDLIYQCIEAKQRHTSITIQIVSYHKSPLLIKTHEMAHEAMERVRNKYNEGKKEKLHSL
ncbi:MAG: ribonuclease H [Paludibacteraceae bacterium]|nr:ribonuclease H [Paludibacteraceae bacterium]